VVFLENTCDSGSAVVALFAWLIRLNPLLGTIAVYGLVLVALIVVLGWQSYRLKLKELEWKRKVGSGYCKSQASINGLTAA